jgi:hypothetical protein
VTKIFLATPAFDGKVNVQYAISMADTAMALAMSGIKTDFRIHTSGSLLCAERNRLMDSFLKTDCTHILCVDSDLGWPPAAIPAMLSKAVDFVAGCYPTRVDKEFLFRPCQNEDGSLVVDPQKGLIKMLYIPAGFMLIRREVIEKTMKDHPHLKYTPKSNCMPSGYALFNTEIFEGEFWGEDYVFCRHVRESGFDIWVDPQIQFDHAGNIGCLAQVLSNEPPKEKEGTAGTKMV